MVKDEQTLPQSLEEGRGVILAFLKNAPSCPGVYRMLSAKDDVLYVGKAKNLKKRITSYTQVSRLPLRLKRMVSLTKRLEIITTHTEAEALLLEGNMIKSMMPKYNVLLRDDKSFPYIFIAHDHAFPQIMKFRGDKTRKGSYFGPFASNVAVNETLLMLQKGFLLRSCADTVFENRTRPCLLYQIKRCSAPCVQKIDKQGYQTLVEEAEAYLKGKNTSLQERLQKEMYAASDALAFEKAAQLRNRLQALTHIQGRTQMRLGQSDVDVIACFKRGAHACIQVFFYRQGQNYGNQAYFFDTDEEMGEADLLSDFITQFYSSYTPPAFVYTSHALEAVFEDAYKARFETPKRGPKKDVLDHALKNAEEALQRHMIESEKNHALLEKVGALFGLEAAPARIEIYDNSHISGTHALGCMVVSGKNGFMKDAYRRFTIRSSAIGDDYQMMREVMRRRFKEGKIHEADPMPDMLLIDGGKGQLSAVLETLHDMGLHNLHVIGISKGPDRNAGRETFHLENGTSFQLPQKDEALYYVQRLRDEAHRFAIISHRNKRGAALTHSKIDDIPGIGPVFKKMLLAHFGSFKALEAAALKDIEALKGMGKKRAAQIFAYLREK